MKLYINENPKFVMPKFSIGQDVYIHKRGSVSICTITDAHYNDGTWRYGIYSDHLDKDIKEFNCREACLTEKVNQSPLQYASVVIP